MVSHPFLPFILASLSILHSHANQGIIVHLSNHLSSFEEDSHSSEPVRSQLYLHLRKRHSEAQRPVIRMLKNYNQQQYQPFWIQNSISVPNASDAVIKALLAMPDVMDVVTNKIVLLPKIEDTSVVELDVNDDPGTNIIALNTPKLWQLGYSGKGVVVANIDSGVRYSHEALINNYRGYQNGKFNHDYSFWTPDQQVLTPDTADFYGHGSHTMGTLAGSHGIGMVPNATWITAKAFNWSGASTEAGLIAAAQWVMCPTKYDYSSPDCTKGAHVVSCSFGGNQSLTWLNPSVDVWRKAGMIPVFAAGNVDGLCSTIMCPADYNKSIAVGGVQGKKYYHQSGRGPAPDGNIKPDFVAPAVSIRSVLSAADSGRDAYTRLTGTSMATPHIAGALALLSTLHNDTDAIMTAMQATTTRDLEKPKLPPSTCGDTAYNIFPNNIYGWGLPDVCHAANKLGIMCS